MIITAKINDETTVKLCDWNSQYFAQEPAITIQSDDLKTIKELFTDLSKVQILIDDVQVAEYTAYNTYSEIQYLGDTYVPGEEHFSPALRVVLEKTDIADQIKRLDAKVNPVIDFESMSVFDYRDYLLNKVNVACQNDIYQGQEIEINGEPKMFTFKLEDQNNLKVLFDIVATHPEVQYMPYHASTESCEMFSRQDIITVYLTLLIRLTKITTYCNQLNMYIKSIDNKEALMSINYGDELTGEYLENYNSIIEQSMDSMQALLESYLGNKNTEGSETEDNVTGSETENTEDTESSSPEKEA